MWSHDKAAMPARAACTTVKPSTLTYDPPSMRIASWSDVAAPSIVTAPFATNASGAAADAIVETENPTYVPGSTTTVSPGVATFAACWIVRHGAASLPAAASSPEVDT